MSRTAPMTAARHALELSREQILAHRRHVQALDERLPPGPESLRRAAWAGLQDSMPRAALLSIHARVADTPPDILDDSSLAQVWGPRFSAYVVAERDRAPFTLGRFPDDARGRRVALETAAAIERQLGGRRMGYGELGRELGVHGNSFRYATTTGTVAIHWEGARQPEIWTVPAPDIEPGEARLELARRFLHVFGPTTPAALAKWAGIGPAEARGAFEALADQLTEVRTPIGDAAILAPDEAAFRAAAGPPAAARLLPSGDTYYLLWGTDRELLVPEPDRRDSLWTSRVWPGAVLAGGEIVGVWRRSDSEVSVEPWRRLSAAERDAIEAEAASLPLPGLRRAIGLRWST
ncbi:MAG: winged helix DNA-binding domain-containing protein [Chloroflexi bacterium]|nr:winged helix DNA-binding domain-containing protein [Chloroflexota bacterium]